MRILFIGDVVGAAGMTALKSMLPDAISRWEVDLAVVNGENSAGTGFGITEDTYQGIRGAGADPPERPADQPHVPVVAKDLPYRAAGARRFAPIPSMPPKVCCILAQAARPGRAFECGPADCPDHCSVKRISMRRFLA